MLAAPGQAERGTCRFGRAAVVVLLGGLATDDDGPGVPALLDAHCEEPVCPTRRWKRVGESRGAGCGKDVGAVTKQRFRQCDRIHGPARESGRKQGATASFEGSLASTSRAQSVEFPEF